MNNQDNINILNKARKVRESFPEDIHERISTDIYARAGEIAADVTKSKPTTRQAFQKNLDKVITGKYTGFPVMLLLLAIVFWLTISGANYPSGLLSVLLVENGVPFLHGILSSIGAPWWLSGFLIDGVYLAAAWVVSVMLPPMAIFFPLFTLLEDFGYLPRVAFNLDPMFKRVGAHGKQALTMTMGFGCNAAGIVSTRIIDSPRERLIAIITNNFSLCNGRWPTQILIATIFIGSLASPALAGLVSATAVVGITLIGVALMFITSWGLSKTMLKGESSAFSLELPPYRLPRIWQTLYTSLIDRTIFVLWRAVVFAVPAGAVIWLISNIDIGGTNIASHMISAMDPFGVFLGLNGIILLAYIVAIPANEIVIPTILMLTVMSLGVDSMGAGTGVMFEINSLDAYNRLFTQAGWTLLTAVNLMLFSLIHNPCSTTIYTIYKETKSTKWTIVASLLPLVMGFVVTALVAVIWRAVS